MQRRTAIGATLVAGAALSGCASSRVMKSRTADYELPKLPEPGKAIVYVTRPATAMGATRFKVYVDDQQPASEKGSTGGRQYIHFSVSPGKHTIYSKADTWAEIEVTANEGEVVFIQQKALLGGFATAGNSLRKLDQLTGTFDVKSTSPGIFAKVKK